MLDRAKNFSKVEVSGGYDASAFTISLNTGDGVKLPVAPFNITWWNNTDYADPSDDPYVEIDRVTNVAGDTITLANDGAIRTPQEGTSATVKNLSGKIYKMIAGLTAKTINTQLLEAENTSKITVGTTQPTSPAVNDLWFDTN